MTGKKHIAYQIEAIYLPNPVVIPTIVNEITEQLLAHNHPYLVLTMLWEVPMSMLCEGHHSVETWQYKFIKLISLIREKNPGIKILLVIDDWYQPDTSFIDKSLVDDKIYINFFLLLVYQRLLVKCESPMATHWSYDKNNKFLFLTGKPNKPHRIRLLYKLKQQNLLDHATWSLFMDQKNYYSTRALLPELSELEFYKFYLEYEKNPDKIEIVTEQGRFHYSGIPYNVELYQTSLFQIISETLFGKTSPWLTEKTWLTIINQRPFLLAGPVGTLARLQDMGFRTFENYLITHYDSIEDTEQKLNAIVTNACHWVNNINQYADNIAQDVKHNFYLMIALAQKNTTILQQFVMDHALNCDIEEVVKFEDTSDYKLSYFNSNCTPGKPPATADELFERWYNNIKDPSWPSCGSENNFSTLPKWIQQECIEVFGYKKS